MLSRSDSSIGKLRNMRTILMRYARQYPDPQMNEQTESIKRCIQAAEQTSGTMPMPPSEEHEIDAEPQNAPENAVIADNRMHGLGSLLGCEGAGSAAYFNVFNKLIKCNWPHGFSKRVSVVRRPIPSTPC